MRHICLISLAIVLASPVARSQALPDNPAPAPSVQGPWNRVQRFANGDEAVVKTVYGLKIHCRFAGATDAYLFCDPKDAPLGADGYRFDRASVAGVSADHKERNGRIVFAAFLVAGGLWTGIRASKTADGNTAALAGLLGAGLGGLVGYPVACVVGYCPSISSPPPSRIYSFNVGVPLKRFGR